MNTNDEEEEEDDDDDDISKEKTIIRDQSKMEKLRARAIFSMNERANERMYALMLSESNRSSSFFLVS